MISYTNNPHSDPSVSNAFCGQHSPIFSSLVISTFIFFIRLEYSSAGKSSIGTPPHIFTLHSRPIDPPGRDSQNKVFVLPNRG